MTMGTELALELDPWFVTMAGGVVIQINAVGYSEEDDQYVFSALVKGSPNYEITVAKVPKRVVESIRGG